MWSVGQTKGLPPSASVLKRRPFVEADTLAIHGASYEMYGWESIGLRTPFLIDVATEGDGPLAWDALARRFDDTVREHCTVEAMDPAPGAEAATRRLTGLPMKGGCLASVKERIERYLTSAVALASLPSTRQRKFAIRRKGINEGRGSVTIPEGDVPACAKMNPMQRSPRRPLPPSIPKRGL